MKQVRMRIISAVMSFLLIFSGLPMGTVPVWAAEPAASAETLTATPGNAVSVQKDRTASSSDADDDGEIDDGMVVDDRIEADDAVVPADPEKEVKDADVLADPVKTEVIEKAAVVYDCTLLLHEYDSETKLEIRPYDMLFERNHSVTKADFDYWSATPDDYSFLKLYADPDMTEEVTFPFVITSDMELYGTFRFTGTAPKYTVSVTYEGSGRAYADITSGRQNVIVTLTAIPSSGYEFYKWEVISGNVTIASDNTFRIGTGNVKIKAVFVSKQNLYTVTLEDPAGYYPTETFKVRKGDTFDLPSISEMDDFVNHNFSGKIQFDSWTCVEGEDAYSSAEGIQRNLTFRPIWKINYKVHWHDRNGNRLATYQGYVRRGDSIDIAGVNTISGVKYKVKTVYKNPAMTNQVSAHQTITSYTEFYAKCAKLVKIIVQAEGNGSAHVGAPGAGSGDYQEVLEDVEEGIGVYSLRATPDSGSQFKEWQVRSGGVTLNKAATSAQNSFSLGYDDVLIRAVFRVNTYSVNCQAEGNGFVDASPSSGPTGQFVLLSATPQSGWRFKEWKIISGGVTLDKAATSAQNSFTIGTANVEVRAYFEDNSSAEPHNIVVDIDGCGSASQNVYSGMSGRKVTLSATPVEGWQFKKWEVVYGDVTLDKAVTSSENSFTMGTKDVVINAIFEEQIRVEGVIINTGSRSLYPGETFQLKAWPQPANAANKAVTWTSDDPSVATVSSTGLVTAVKPGVAIITVRTKDGAYSAFCRIAVKSVPVTSVKINTTAKTLAKGATFQLAAWPQPTNATNKTVIWSSSNTAVATVSSTGLVKGVKAGTATITVKTEDGGKTATCKITVQAATTVPVTSVKINSTAKTLAPGQTFQLAAWPQPTNATNKAVTWYSFNTSVATVSSTGLVTAKGPGSTNVRVMTKDGGKIAYCKITVQAAATVPVTSVKINSTAKTLAKGATFQLAAWPQPTNATNKAVTWYSFNPSVATVSSSGLVTAKGKGSTNVRVMTKDGGKIAYCKITVN